MRLQSLTQTVDALCMRVSVSLEQSGIPGMEEKPVWRHAIIGMAASAAAICGNMRLYAAICGHMRLYAAMCGGCSISSAPGRNMVTSKVPNAVRAFTSEKKSSDASPPSRDTPDAFTPPNGMCSSRCSQQLTHTVPHSSAAATACARLEFSVHTEAERPYRVWFCRVRVPGAGLG